MMIKKWKTGIIATAIAATFYMASMTPLFAQQDFSLCDGLRGASFGICHAGLAVGCDKDDTLSSTQCLKIEGQFIKFAGTPPPWLICPCFAEEDLAAITRDNVCTQTIITDNVGPSEVIRWFFTGFGGFDAGVISECVETLVNTCLTKDAVPIVILNRRQDQACESLSAAVLDEFFSVGGQCEPFTLFCTAP